MAAKGLAAFGLARLAGAILGRTVLAIIVAAVLCLGLYFGGEIGRGRGPDTSAQVS